MERWFFLQNFGHFQTCLKGTWNIRKSASCTLFSLCLRIFLLVIVRIHIKFSVLTFIKFQIFGPVIKKWVEYSDLMQNCLKIAKTYRGVTVSSAQDLLFSSAEFFLIPPAPPISFSQGGCKMKKIILKLYI